MADETNSQENAERLLHHLKDDSLAAQLVHAHRTADGNDPNSAMKTVINERLQQVRAKIDGTTD